MKISDPSEEIPKIHVPVIPAESVPVFLPVVPMKRSPPSSEAISKSQRQPANVPYDVYVAVARECDFLRGQNFKLRCLVDSIVVGPYRVAPTSPSQDINIRVRALVEIATRHMAEMITAEDEDMDPVKMTRFTRQD